MLARTLQFAGCFGRACLDLFDGFAAGQPTSYRLPDGYRRIYQYHIPKTGGTSLNYSFVALGGEDGRTVYQRLIQPDAPLRRTTSGGKVFVGWDARLIEQGRYFYAFSHLPSHRLRMPARTFTVTCLRDPVQRVVSLYRELVKYRSWNADHPCRATTDVWLGASFREFLRNIPRHELLAHLAMFSPRLDLAEALDGILACSFAFRTEDFAAECAALGRRLDLPLTVLHARQSNHRVEVSQPDLNLLAELLEPEYRLLERFDAAQRSPAPTEITQIHSCGESRESLGRIRAAG